MKRLHVGGPLATVVAMAFSLPAHSALELYVDAKTNQVYTTPGPGRHKLGEFEQINSHEKSKDHLSSAQDKSTSKISSLNVATADQVKSVEDKLNARIDSVVNKPKKPNEAKTQIDGKGIRFETNDGAFKFSLNGRLHTDADMFSGGDFVTYNDINNSGKYDPQNKKDGGLVNNVQSDGTEIRRFRMEFAGQFYDDWKFKMQPELANGGGNLTVGIRDAYVNYTGFGDAGNFYVGQSKQPYSYQQMMSSNDMVFMERSTEYVFTNISVNRAIGLRYDVGKDWWGFSTGIYGDTATRQASGTTATTQGDDEGWGAAARGTIAPWYKSDEIVHLGGSAAYRAPRTGDNSVRYSQAPTAISHFSYLDTGNLRNLRNMQFINGELLGIYGPLSIESEYNAAWINGNDASTVINGVGPAGSGYLQGAHVDVAYSLTGESRATSYDPVQGVVKKFKPNHNLTFSENGWGGWELKGRFMWLDMNQMENSWNQGGSQVASTFGANWYFNDWARFMVDWTHVYSLDVGKAGTNRTVLGNQNTGDWDYVQARVDLHY